MALKRLDAPAVLRRLLAHRASGRQLPHLDRLVKTAADEHAGVRRECHAVDAVLVALGALEALQEIAHLNVPHPDALVERAGGHVLGIRRDGNGSNAVLNSERQSVHAALDIPKPDCPVATARGNGAAITGEIERVNILIVTLEGVANLSLLNVPNLNQVSTGLLRLNPWRQKLNTHPNQLVLGASGKVLAIRTEAHTPNVEIPVKINALILKHANLFARGNVVDLRRPITTSRNILAVMAEPHTADHTFVLERVDQIDV